MTSDRAIAPRRSPRQPRSAARVQKIMRAYERLLRGGTTKISTHHIAEEAGIPVSSIYQYFPNKEALAFAMYQEWAGEVKKELRGMRESAAATEDWRSYLFDRPNMFLDDPASWRVMGVLTPVMNTSKKLKTAQRKVLLGLRQELAALLRELGSSWPDAALNQAAALLIEFSTSAYHYLHLQETTDAAIAAKLFRVSAEALCRECLEKPAPD